ncbi:FecR family protein [Chitinophaga sp. RAB17]|uniref:FecR family protein n=1 Tax=Chitinophaga sp. RAB17 TaxID=3233049 RepID=UPI003F8F74DB
MPKRLSELLALHWSGEISAAEKAELDELLLQHPGDWLKAGQMEQLSFRKVSAFDEEDADRLVDRVSSFIEEESRAQASARPVAERRRFMARKWLVSLLVVVGCAGGLLTYYYKQSPFAGYKIVTTDAGMKTRIRMADGSTILLNAGSTLRYPEKMDKAFREVYLTGEAYFDIKHAASRPFIIHAEKMDVRVLGTSFNIRSYKEEDFEETAVISGAVEVVVKEGQQVFRIAPNEKVLLRKASAEKDTKGNAVNTATTQGNIVIERQPLSPISSTDSSRVLETAWINNQLIFQNETLSAIVQRLERWYGVKIIIRDPQLAALRFSGRADNVPIEKLLNILQEIQPFKYSIQDDIITIN